MGTLDLLKVFTEPQRLRILHLLKSTDLNVNELVEILNLSQSNISHHLKILKNLGLVDLQKKGNQNYYISVPSPDLPEAVKRIWSKTSELISELHEAKNDERNLVMVLSERNTPEESGFYDWRKKQPDLPYTHEFLFMGSPSSDIALDIGSGSGDLLPLLAESYKKVLGIDISLHHMMAAKEKFQNNHFGFICANAESLPIPSSFIDTAFYRMTLGFVKDKEKALLEALRVLKRKGKISVIDQNTVGKKNHQALTREFFEKFCEQKPARLVKFQEYQQVFLCSIEKTND